ncbi:transglutaminase-like domain-containing protein [Propioniciclava soli]|uniref:Transglutaminase family protein n=1 Tax=Propioniciclava soli TaxID=2775081 RepID=A0ABZ3C4Y2_9ACTN|nr:transglutaminase family protein [Propioniciclava soli]
MTTRTLTIGASFRHVAQLPTPTLAMIEHKHDEVETLSSGWTTTPDIEMTDYTDLYGNVGKRFIMPAGESVYEYRAVVKVPDAVDEADLDAPQLDVADLPEDVLPYLWPSRYCQSDVLGRDAWNLFGDMEPGYRRCMEISNFVHERVQYRTGSTMSWYTAVDAFNNGYGICRDLAHTFIALCRAMNIPARYVSGYLPDMDVPPLPVEMDFHAFTEVYLGDRWWTFDPRHNARRKGHIVISRGRDAVDCALATTFGNPWLKRMIVTTHESDEQGNLLELDGQGRPVQG